MGLQIDSRLISVSTEVIALSGDALVLCVPVIQASMVVADDLYNGLPFHSIGRVGEGFGSQSIKSINN